MIPTIQTRLRRAPVLALAALVLSLGCSACALSKRPAHPDKVTATQMEAGVEPYFYGGKVTYQIQISRQLNPFSTEDVQYLTGIKGAQNLGLNQLWFGVFIWAKNQSNGAAITLPYNDFEIKDSEGTVYHPTPLPSINPYAWTQQTLQPNDTEPNPDSTAAFGPTQGGLVLFKLNTSIYNNRPLTLYLDVPGQKSPSYASLDL